MNKQNQKSIAPLCTDVYFSPLINALSEKQIFPKEREEEITSVVNERVKSEKYSAWLLLEHALLSSLGLTMRDAELYKDENGKWRSSKCELSISHGGGAVAVAISHEPVGIDVEPINKSISQSFAKRFLTPDEYLCYSNVSDGEKSTFLLTRWCMKEAIFKKSGEKAFLPSHVSSNDSSVLEKRFSLENEEFVLAIACNAPDSVRFFSVPKDALQ